VVQEKVVNIVFLIHRTTSNDDVARLMNVVSTPKARPSMRFGVARSNFGFPLPLNDHGAAHLFEGKLGFAQPLHQHEAM
jgi:hypothetical protein